MVRRHAHLPPNHLTEHARKIDEVMGGNVTNLALLKALQDSNISSIDMFYMDKIVFDKICTNIYTNR
ncbi:hypothetical protein DVP60_19135 [Yersinia enterocolitica]|nr:hypothetical protein [Yersinia enterocolitica]